MITKTEITVKAQPGETLEGSILETIQLSVRERCNVRLIFNGRPYISDIENLLANVYRKSYNTPDTKQCVPWTPIVDEPTTSPNP